MGTKFNFNTEDTIILGNHLDVILNVNEKSLRAESSPNITKMTQFNSIRFKGLEEKTSDADDLYDLYYDGGLVMPKRDESATKSKRTGTGNMVIIGKPGVGKSTLAFQIGLSCTLQPNNGISVYYTLGVPRTHLLNGMLKDGWEENSIDKLTPEEAEKKIDAKMDVYPINRCKFTPDEADVNDDEELLWQCFQKMLITDGNKVKSGVTHFKPQMLLPRLTPSGFAMPENSGQDALFRRRYTEIEYLLKAVRRYNKKYKGDEEQPLVKAVIIDSLNDFDNKPLTKAEVHKLFELFEYYGIMGIFTMSENEFNTDDELINVEAVKYDADTVVKLEGVQHGDYYLNLFSVVKSRGVKAVLGEHPYKIRNEQIFRYNSLGNITDKMRKFVDVLPSLHHVIAATGDMGQPSGAEKVISPLCRIEGLQDVLPSAIRKYAPDAHIVTISGRAGMLKADIAANALLWSLIEDKASGLFIRMSDRNKLSKYPLALNKGLNDRISDLPNNDNSYKFKDGSENLFVISESKPCICAVKDNQTKRTIFYWQHEERPDTSTEDNNPKPVSDPKEGIYELIYKSGALLPEEFMEDVLYFIYARKVRNVVLSDIKYISTSFPFLSNSRTSGRLFLSAFVHIMKNLGINLIVTCSKNEFAPADEDAAKMRVLSDTNIELDYVNEKDISKGVMITGEGAIITEKHAIIKKVTPDKKITVQFCENGEEPATSEGTSDDYNSYIEIGSDPIAQNNEQTQTEESTKQK